MHRIIELSLPINYWFNLMSRNLTVCLFLSVVSGSASCSESRDLVAESERLGVEAASDSATQTVTQWSATASPGATGGSIQLEPGIAAIYAVKFVSGKASLSAAAVLRGEPGWVAQGIDSSSDLGNLVHAGIGATLGTHSVVFDPIATQLWIDDNQSLPVATNNVLMFQVAPRPDKPLRLTGQRYLDPALGSIPSQGYSQLLKERLRAKLMPLISAN